MAAALLDRVLGSLDEEGKGVFCYECGAPDVVVETRPVGEQFRCSADHVAQRCYLFDGKAAYSVEDGRLIHETVAAVVRRDQKMLLFRRTRYPIGFTIPAGHMERGKDPEQEMARELFEEVGLNVTSARAVWGIEPPVLQDSCRRGADYHRWRLYEAEAEGTVALGHEGDAFGWYSDGQIYDLAANRLLIPPVREIFHRLGVI